MLGMELNTENGTESFSRIRCSCAVLGLNENVSGFQLIEGIYFNKDVCDARCIPLSGLHAFV